MFNIHKLADLYATNPLKACRKALRMTAGIDSQTRLEAINTLLGTHGTEAIRGDWQNGYWCDIVANYCNTGDSYDLTVMEVRTDFGGSRFIITSYGDWVEKNTKRFGLQ